jgi:hypothetical protein
MQVRDAAWAKIEEHYKSQQKKPGGYTALSTGDVIFAIEYFSNLPQIERGSSTTASEERSIVELSEDDTHD